MNLKLSLRNLILFVSIILAGCTQKQYLSGSVAATRITGKVYTGKSGLSNVCVSDGYNVTTTDKKGKYILPFNEKAKFVFVSIPSGYDFPQEKGIPRCYKLIDRNEKKGLNFELKKLALDDLKHNFIIWADPQIMNDNDFEKMMKQSVPDTKKLVASLGNEKPVHGIVVGDLVWDNHALFPKYCEAIAGTGIPFFQTLGNHDMDYNKGGDETSDQTFQSYFGPDNYSFNRGKAHYIVLDDVWYLGKDKDYMGKISQEQIDWIQKDLSYVPAGNLVIVCVHIPIHLNVENKEKLYQLLQPYNAHIMSGHSHTNLNVLAENTYEHEHGALCGAWWTGPVCEDGAPRGYGVYEVDGANIKWYYKSVEQDKNYQFSLFLETNGNGENEVIANVWNWDPMWKVEWWADADYKGVLKNTSGYDPLATALYKGDGIPAGRTFPEPAKTSHIFKDIVPAGTKEVKVKVTDRFGNVYESVAKN